MWRSRSVLFLLICGMVIPAASGCGGDVGTTGTAVKNNSPVVGAPASIGAVAGNGTVTLAWSEVSGADSYRIYRSLSTPATRATGSLVASGLTSTAYIDAAVTNGTTYYYVMTSLKGAVESEESQEVFSTPGATGTIRGTIRYEDKEYGPAGFNGTTHWKTIRYATVDVVDAASGSVLYTTATDSQGAYSVLTSPSSTQVYVRVNSAASLPGSGTISVKDLSSNFYGVPSNPFPLSGAAFINISMPVSNIADGAFNILDVMTIGYEFVRDYDGMYPVSSVTAFWSAGNGLGTYFCTTGDATYCTGGSGIYVLSDPLGDTDEFDDDVLWHEFGHFVAYSYSRDDSPGGIHYLTDSALDLRLAWSEGWGDFFPGAVKTWLNATNPSLLSSATGMAFTTYVDTSNNSWSFDFGNPPYNSSYATSEVAVAKLLTDHRAAFGMQNIWNVMTNYQASPPPYPIAVNLELFWDRWRSVVGTGSLPTLEALYSARSIIYRDDPWEPNETYLSASTYTGVQNRTLYSSSGSADKDYVLIAATTGTTYTITTSNLYNGADTFLTLYNATGTTVLTSDDNRNGSNTTYTACPASDMSCDYGFPLNTTTNLSSKITFKATYTGPYYVEVKAAQGRPNSAGRYGSYTLMIAHSP
jgi:hypothetical protein